MRHTKDVLTKHFDGQVLNIETEIGLREYSVGKMGPYDNYNGLWDTGATMSCISPKVAEELGLTPAGLVNLGGVSGDILACPVFVMDIRLSNGIEFHAVRVAGAKPAGTDVLIGMDIISRGDFSIFHDAQGDMNMKFEA